LPLLPATCHAPGRPPAGRQQRYACRPCGRDYTATSATAFAGYRWPADVILMAVRWYLSLTVSARQVTWLLAERGVDVTPRTVLTWTQTFGPQLAADRGGPQAPPPRRAVLVRR
jgi:transposase-like protein